MEKSSFIYLEKLRKTDHKSFKEVMNVLRKDIKPYNYEQLTGLEEEDEELTKKEIEK